MTFPSQTQFVPLNQLDGSGLVRNERPVRVTHNKQVVRNDTVLRCGPVQVFGVVDPDPQTGLVPHEYVERHERPLCLDIQVIRGFRPSYRRRMSGSSNRDCL